MAYDSARGVTVLFGGVGTGNFPNDTWEWNGTTWSQASPEASPPAQSNHAMAYDSSRGVTVLFGGNDGDYFGDTWEWNGTNWTQLSPATSPGERYLHMMAYDSARGVTVLFGGTTGQGLLSDTWEWNGTIWTQASPATSPPERCFHAMAYDNTRGVTVLFGGINEQGLLRDTWEWNGMNWTQLIPEVTPLARVAHALVYDKVRGVAVLFGGFHYDGISPYLGDTWEWNGTIWTQRSPVAGPSARYSHAMAYDIARGVSVLFGGYNGGGYLGDIWEWNGTIWTQRNQETSPLSRGAHAMAYDSARGVTVIFGGIGNGNILDDTWEWNGMTWTQANPATRPPARYGCAMAYDSTRGMTMWFGGINGSISVVGDTWEWNGANWMNRSPATSPPARGGHAMAYDSARGVTVLFGGFYYDGSPYYHGDTWEWDGTNWTQRNSTTSPSARYGHAMAYDSARGVTVLFGGTTNSGSGFSDTWEWDSTTWTYRGAATSPPERYLHAMAYDCARSKTVLYGGTNNMGFITLLGDTWEWDGVNWAPVSLANTLPPRYSHSLAFDSARNVTILFAGYNNVVDGWLGDIWTFGPTGPAPTITQHPASPLVCEHSSISLRAAAVGDGPLSYQWRKNGADLADDEDTFGTQSDRLVIARAHPADSGNYACLVTLNDCTRAVTNPAALTVFPTGSADGNGDTLSDGRDIQAFIDSLINHHPVSSSLCAYDLNADGVVNLADVPGFTQKLVGL